MRINGMAWERHAMCESAFMVPFVSCQLTTKYYIGIKGFLFSSSSVIFCARLKYENRLEFHHELTVLNNIVMLYSLLWGVSPAFKF